ncbi:hypothetical protein [Nocardiopsis dassonvillei]|uniref:hypothetical protein n=1 Tax=Nocardiopsis dassonvillei TaxID=2014 RepID=UPI00366DC180
MRLIPPLVLLVLSPFVGEYLLGNITPEPATWAFMLLPLVLLYGGGALLIREVTRRLGRGYPTMFVLAVGYGLIEEGIVLGTLFNREYLGLGLLEYGWTPELGTSPVWSSYVVGIHSVWSILVPIVLVELLFPARAREPWLRVPGTVGVAVVYLLGGALLGLGNYYTYRFFASPAQVAVVLALVAACVVCGLLLRPGRARDGRVPHPLALAAVALVCGSGFILVQENGVVPAAVTLAVMFSLALTAGAVLLVSSGRAGWTVHHTLGAVAGAVATYCWAGFMIQFGVHGYSAFGLVGQVVCVGAAAGLVALAWRRSAVTAASPSGAASPA